MFSSVVCESLGWYVYALRNPIDHRIFYIGKGKDNRVFQHAIDAEASNASEVVTEKIGTINQIHAAGLEVEAFIVRHGISSEKVAYDIEAAVIDTMRLLDSGLTNETFGLTNLVLGHHHGARGLGSVADVASMFEAPPAPAIPVPAVLIKIARLWTPAMPADELYDATRQWWKIGTRRAQAKFAFAVSRGVIREVYSIGSWTEGSWDENDQRWVVPPRAGEARRWSFEGTVAPELAEFRRTSVVHLIGRSQSPINYVNC